MFLSVLAKFLRLSLKWPTSSMPYQFIFRARRRRFSLFVSRVSYFRRGIGLMFRTKYTRPLLFAFHRPCRVALTSWFVFFPFVAVWLDDRRRVIEARVILPFTLTIVPHHSAHYLVEIPLNRRNSKITRFLVGK